MKKDIPVIIKIVTQTDEQCVPYGDADGRENYISGIALFACPGYEGYVSPADGDDSPHTDGEPAPVAEGAVGCQDGLFTGWKPGHDFFQQRRASVATNGVSETGTCQTGSAAIEYKKGQGKSDTRPKGAGEGEDEFAGDRKACVFQCDKKDDGRCAIGFDPL